VSEWSEWCLHAETGPTAAYNDWSATEAVGWWRPTCPPCCRHRRLPVVNCTFCLPLVPLIFSRLYVGRSGYCYTLSSVRLSVVCLVCNGKTRSLPTCRCISPGVSTVTPCRATAADMMAERGAWRGLRYDITGIKRRRDDSSEHTHPDSTASMDKCRYVVEGRRWYRWIGRW